MGEAGSYLITPTQLDREIFAAAAALRRSLCSRRAALRLVGVTLSRLVPDDGTRAMELFEEECRPGGMAGGARSAGAGRAASAGRTAGAGRKDPAGDDPLEAAARAAAERAKDLGLLRSLDRIRERFGYSSVVSGKSLHLLGKLPQDAYGYILRTPSLTR